MVGKTEGSVEQRRNHQIVEAQQFLRFRPETRLSEAAVKDFKLRYSEVLPEILDELLAIEAEREADARP